MPIECKKNIYIQDGKVYLVLKCSSLRLSEEPVNGSQLLMFLKNVAHLLPCISLACMRVSIANEKLVNANKCVG